MSYNPALLADFYKLSHRAQYPSGTQFVYSTWIPRGSRIEGVTGVVAFGFQAFIKRYLVDYFNEHFFTVPAEKVIDDYREFITATLGDPDPDYEHLLALHRLGYLPLEIRAVPEGSVVPLRVPMLTIENTNPEFFWLTNFIETLFSAECWMPSTSATIAHEYRKMLDQWAAQTSTQPEFVTFQGHDFSMRGMPSVEAAAASGAGHLLSFVGTDTIPAILFAKEFYGADYTKYLVGTSIPATEHSVMCAYGREHEADAYRRFITETYPTGLVSIVSDTYNLWDVLRQIIGEELKNDILARDGKVVVRPDSGTPVDILTGTVAGHLRTMDPLTERPFRPESKGVVEILWDIFGGTFNEKGYKELDPHIGVIYGDAITLERARAICQRLEAKGFASTNVVYGIGSYTYQHQTRDTFGFALKSTWVQINGIEHNIFKDPVTDSGLKKSLTGRVAVLRDADGSIYVKEGLSGRDWELLSTATNQLLQPVFHNGSPLRRISFAQARVNLRNS